MGRMIKRGKRKRLNKELDYKVVLAEFADIWLFNRAFQEHIRDLFEDHFMSVGGVDHENKEDAIIRRSTGFQVIDKALGGIEPTDVILVAGYPGIGKTALILNILMKRCIEEGNDILFISNKHYLLQILYRMIGVLSSVDSFAIERGLLNEDDKFKVVDAIDRINRSSFTISEIDIMTSWYSIYGSFVMTLSNRKYEMVIIDNPRFFSPLSYKRKWAIYYAAKRVSEKSKTPFFITVNVPCDEALFDKQPDLHYQHLDRKFLKHVTKVITIDRMRYHDTEGDFGNEAVEDINIDVYDVSDQQMHLRGEVVLKLNIWTGLIKG